MHALELPALARYADPVRWHRNLPQRLQLLTPSQNHDAKMSQNPPSDPILRNASPLQTLNTMRNRLLRAKREEYHAGRERLERIADRSHAKKMGAPAALP